MSHPLLKRGMKSDDVRTFQDLLNKTGALLETDADFGKGTEAATKEAQQIAGMPATGIADEATWDWLEAQPRPSTDLSTADVTFIAREETTGRAYYDKFATSPEWPGVESGMTIGVGYDLRFHDDDFDADWGDQLTSAEMDRLRPYLGVKGSKAAVELLKDVRIPFYKAWTVFWKRTLPNYIGQTKGVYPEFDTLYDGCRGALVSLVFNRGASVDPTKDRRKEMHAIQEHLAAGEWDKVADEIEAMKRLWPDAKGLRDRRDREAALWRQGMADARNV